MHDHTPTVVSGWHQNLLLNIFPVWRVRASFCMVHALEKAAFAFVTGGKSVNNLNWPVVGRVGGGAHNLALSSWFTLRKVEAIELYRFGRWGWHGKVAHVCVGRTLWKEWFLCTNRLYVTLPTTHYSGRVVYGHLMVSGRAQSGRVRGGDLQNKLLGDGSLFFLSSRRSVGSNWTVYGIAILVVLTLLK